MLQETYKEVENIINGTKKDNEMRETGGLGKFNYYGKRYRFEIDEENRKKMLESVTLKKE